MLNLLFISDSPKAEYVKGVLQNVLKVIIDVVTDFDHGLKDVFEKRPSTVCIQDQIGGVTGESVARHIQMLLGTSAPTFILLHTGNDKARAVKGLYEHIIDLNQTNDALAEEIINTLKSLLGDQWVNNCILPKPKPASIRSTVAIPEESRKDADKLVNDFLFDLESSGFSVADDQPPVLSAPDKVTNEWSSAPQSETQLGAEDALEIVESDRAQSLNDDLVELLLIEVSKGRRDEHSAAVSSGIDAEPGYVIIDAPKSATATVKNLNPVTNVPPASSAQSEPYSGKKQSEKTVAAESEKVQAGIAAAPVTLAPTPTIVQTPGVAEFRTSHNAPKDEEHIDDDLLLAFEENYRSEPMFLRRSVVVVLISFVCAAGVWYFVKQKPQIVNSLKLRFMPSTTKQASVAVSVQKPVPPPVQQPIMTKTLPAFVPSDGHDSSFAVKKPGWERYVGKLNEFRLFNASGRIQAIQVLALKDTPIPESLIKSVLQEFAGSQEYKIISRNMKAGVRVERGRIQNKGEVVIYRENGAVKAFVVSVN